jgi:ankyrin repeat protein
MPVEVRDKYEWTPLYRAAYNGHVEAVKALVAYGANKSVKDERGKTPSQMACKGGNKQNMEMIIALLEVRRLRDPLPPQDLMTDYRTRTLPNRVTPRPRGSRCAGRLPRLCWPRCVLL